MAYNNRYQKKAARSGFISSLNVPLDTKGNPKNTVMETGKDLVVGVVGGGLMAAVIGKPSFLTGLAITLAGHYFGNRLSASLGLGMMAGNNFINQGMSGIDGLDGVKERLSAYKHAMLEKLYIDKILKKKIDQVSGFGNLQYFNYGEQMTGDFDNPELNGDLAALNEIEQQIEDSGMSRLQMGSLREMEFEGVGDQDFESIGEISEYNF